MLRYPRVQAQHQLTEDQIVAFATDLQAMAAIVELSEATPVGAVVSDPDDHPILQTAVYGQADVLCTLDRHFHHPDVQEFCAQHGIRVRSDVELLQILRTTETPPPADNP